ncbi:hypothetical protein HMI55_006693 [Coelomomyces lativittatus]|nr:hypothetical protein HMI55_006693 [Coelomomyces lativittatus]
MTKVKFLHAFPYFIPPFEPCPGTSTSSFRSLFQLQGVALVAGLHRLPPFLLQEWEGGTKRVVQTLDGEISVLVI